MDNRIPVTIITGGYNNNIVDALITETYPRWKGEYIKFVHEDTDVRMYIDWPFNADSNVLRPAKCSITVVEEPYWCVPEFNHFICYSSHLFDAIFTNHTTLLMLGKPNIHYYPGFGGSIIAPWNWMIHEKSENMCAIFSQKNYAIGHKLRQQIRNDSDFSNKVHFNNDIPFVSDSYHNKIDLMRQYRYCIAIENEFDTLMTDKILDCFLTGCIPIYKGAKRVREYFNMDGVIEFDDIAHLKQIVSILSGDAGEWWYDLHIDAVRQNLETAKKYTNLGDVLWTHGLEEVFKQKGIIGAKS